ncbi:MAG: DUF4209 domain-containing protein [Patescibacteria group bacterium]|nr:DUF4209 domain-containing protein [Patescibacteria group bacterium]MDE2057730.1 DUF4209 domain-containing protein [Patescibacteria group bacterium]
MLEKILTYLRSLDAAPGTPLKETDVSQGIKNAIGQTDEKASGESLYEILAFDLFPRHEGHESEWGTRFGSMMSGTMKDSSETWEYPSRTQIDASAIDYWTKRARESAHPILLERYADVAYDLAQLVGKKADYTLAQLVIDTSIKICDENLIEDTYQRMQLHRALALAMHLNDKDRIKSVAECVIRVEKKIEQDDKPGLWGFAFKWLVLENAEKVNLDPVVRDALVKDLEDRLIKFTSASDPEPWLVENAALPLVAYYSRIGNGADAVRVLLSLEDAFRKNARSNSDSLLKVHYLEKLDALYRENGSLPGMRENIERIANELPTASKESLSSFKEIGAEIKIERKDVEKITNDIFTLPVDGNLPTLAHVRSRIVGNFISRKDHAAKMAEDMAKKFVFVHIMGQRRVAPEGHTVAELPPYNENPDAHTISQAFQSLQISSVFLGDALARFRKDFSASQIADLFWSSGLFQEDEKEYLMKGLEAYWRDDPFNASHTFIPYIETLIRRLILHSGGVIITPNTKPGTYGGYSYKTLGLLLNENAQLIDKIYKFSATFYFELVLVHPLGWNLRNDFAHGASLNSLFRQDIADRLFHILLLLSLVVEQNG